jgi:medium-chain acyl-[acyl-carrier-protein] hydrolase
MSTTPVTSRWLSGYKPNPRAALRLFCFPYAGGAANIFHSWPNSLPPSVEVCPVQLPGRGNRLPEPAFTGLELLVESAARELLPFFDKPFAFFGHSMGAIISFELANRLRLEQRREPVHLFVSGRQAPQIPVDEMPTYNLPEKDFLDELRRLKGTPADVLEHAELMQLMLPLLRADFELIQTYRFAPRPLLDCPITAFGGMEDTEVTRESLEAWREMTTGAFKLRMLPGDNFFLNTARPLFLQTLARDLQQGAGREHA